MAPNDPLYLDEAGEWVGLWWMPDHPREQIPGVLRYDAEGNLSLSLIGAFDDRITSNPVPGLTLQHEGTRTWDVIHGAAEQREITLLGCVPIGGNRTVAARIVSPDSQTVAATTAVIGAHIGSENDPAFATAEVSVEDLGLWAASSAFERLLGSPDDKFDGTGSISVRPVEAQSVEVDGTEYCLIHTHTLPFFDHRKGETIGRMRDAASIRITPSDPFTLRAALKAAKLVQDLIALATHRAAGMIWLRLQVPGTESVTSNGAPAALHRAAVLYSPAALGKQGAEAIDGRRVFFTCESIPFEEVIPRWCEAHDRLQAAINMILGLRYAPATFVENNLLTAVGAGEVLHRSLLIDEKPFPRAEFAAMRAAMLEQIPAEYRGRFKKAIRNDPNLQDRLRALAARPSQNAISLLMPDVAHWAKRTTHARNDLAHEGRTPNHSVEELMTIVEITTAVVILNVLQELGLPAERQCEIVRQHPQLRATSHKAHKWLLAAELNP
jgi:hypothetical protein